MTLADFRIGTRFTLSGKRYRCTDVGTRVVVAIRLDGVRVSRSQVGGRGIEAAADKFPGPVGEQTILTAAEAEADGWFVGPPFAVVEHVIDETDLSGCEPL